MVRLAGIFGATDHVLNLYWKKVTSNFRKEVAETGAMNEIPQWAYLEATMKCNLNCKICHQKDRRFERNDMATDEFFKVVDKIKKTNIPVINMTGGEMFLRPDILSIIGYVDKAGIPLKINTNGTLIKPEHIQYLKGCKSFDCLGTSIDGTRHIHNAARGNERSFDLTTSMLHSLRNVHFQKMMCFTMTEHNAECIEDMLKLAADLRVNRILFMNEHFSRPGDIEKSTEILGVETDIFMGTEEKNSAYVQLMMTVQAQIKRLRKKYPVLAPIYPIISNNRPEEFYNRKYSCSLFCKAFHAFVIASNGDVRVCQFIKEPVGNILRQSVNEIWNCEKMKRMRMAILSNKSMLPICASCPCLEEVR